MAWPRMTRGRGPGGQSGPPGSRRALDLLAGVLEAEEQDLGHGTVRALQRREQVDLQVVRSLPSTGQPLRQGSTFVEVGRDQVHDFVQGRGQGNLVGGDGSVAVIGGLEDPGVTDDLSSDEAASDPAGPAVRGFRRGCAPDGSPPGRPAGTGHHGFDRLVFGSDQVGEECLFSGAHDLPLSHCRSNFFPRNCGGSPRGRRSKRSSDALARHKVPGPIGGWRREKLDTRYE
jgi:hypothetical protein